MCDEKEQELVQEEADGDGRHYKCLFCDTNFSLQASLVLHWRSMHKYTPSDKPASNASEIDHNYHKRPTCSQCNKQMQNSYKLEKHKCKTPKQMEEEETLESETQPEITSCHICKKNFSSQEAYVKHINEFVSKYKPFYCCICQTTFARKRSMVFHLYIHKRSSEPDSKVSRLSDIILPTLPKVSIKKQLNKRLDDKKAEQNKLPAKKPSKDKHFSKGLPQIIDIRKTVQSKQICEKCQRNFMSVLELERHMVKRHRIPLRYICSLCSLSFALKASLMNHAVSHIF